MSVEDQHLANLTLGQAEDAYHQGQITADQWEGYMHSWATSAARFSTVSPVWKQHTFVTPEARRVAELLGCCTDAYKEANHGIHQR